MPEGYHTLTPHIWVKDGAAAIEFYKKAFGAEELTRSLAPDGKAIMHASIRIGDSILMLTEEMGENRALKSPGSAGTTTSTLHLYVEDPDAVFDQAVGCGAIPAMPVDDMFWGDRYGMLIDPFGHCWAVAAHIKDVSPEEMAEAAKAFFAQG